MGAILEDFREWAIANFIDVRLEYVGSDSPDDIFYVLGEIVEEYITNKANEINEIKPGTNLANGSIRITQEKEYKSPITQEDFFEALKFLKERKNLKSF